jgi:hypothetical protein
MWTRLICLAFVAVLWPTIVWSHSWYPKRCCDDHDCFPADRLERLADGTLLLARGRIVVRVTKSFPIEPSPGGRVHFCIWDGGWGPEPRCVFLPAEG